MTYRDLDLPPRVLLGPGPSLVPPRVLRVMATPPVGYLDPEFFKVMDETQALLRHVWQTQNPLTLPLSGTGSAGMEAVFANFIEPGDRVLVGVNGFFSERMCEMAVRYGGVVTRLEKPWGEVFTPQELEAALQAQSYKLVALVQAETSTGALQPMSGLGELVHQHGALLALDCVTSLGGVPVQIDAWSVDIAYSATQKCLGCPSGLAPFTVSPRAQNRLRQRTRPPSNWYLDLALLEKYWGPERQYHHTLSASLLFALREGLRIVQEEGLEARWLRHQQNAEQLWAGLEALDLGLHVPLVQRLPTLTTVQAPSGRDEASLRTRLRDDYNIEIAGGFGPLKGRVWRVGLMGYSSRRENVSLLLAALGELLAHN